MPPDIVVIKHTVIALLLGWALGYERFFRGRASGTQVYCLVSTASCALTSAAGLGAHWFDRTIATSDISAVGIVAALLTGIGFLGAGIIVKSGTNIRGLTTAASIWSSSAIGILVGIDFVGAALALTAMFIVSMVAIPMLERHLPGSAAIVVNLRYRQGARPQEEQIFAFLKERGLSVQTDTWSLGFDGTHHTLEFTVSASGTQRDHSLTHAVTALPEIPTIESFSVTRTTRA